MSDRSLRRLLRLFAAVFSACCLLCSTSVARAADEEDEDEPKFSAGLVAEYRQGNRTAKRVDQDVQFVWNGTRPDERLTSGDFTAKWNGLLFAQLPGEYRFHVYAGGGELRLEIGGVPVIAAVSKEQAWHVSEPVKLRYGNNPLYLGFQRTNDTAVLKLHWSGPQFAVEPVPERNLFHDPKLSPSGRFEEGAALVRVHRCAACHQLPDGRPPLPAPALTHLTGNIEPSWLVAHLAANKPATDAAHPTRRMPFLHLDESAAKFISAYLLSRSAKSPEVKLTPPIEHKIEPAIAHDPRQGDPPKKRKAMPRSSPTVRDGELLARSVGCLACHSIGATKDGNPLGTASLYSGGNLTEIARKRPPEFFARWLADPAKINADHRMPMFKLTELEQADLGAYLATLGAASTTRERASEPQTEMKSHSFAKDVVELGRRLVASHRCASCHRLPADDTLATTKVSLSIKPNWENSCFGAPDAAKYRPGYFLDAQQRASVGEYLSQAEPKSHAKPTFDGRFVLAERNCITCHARGLGSGIAEHAPKITTVDDELLPMQAALLPPSLNGVGDKLTEEAMTAAIELKRPPLRPWLKVRMPKFALAPDELAALKSHLIDHDRIPDLPPPAASAKTEDDAATATAQRLAARRLVTSDGFGCTSCHKIGKAEPAGIVNIAAHGTDLTLLGARLRKPWFDRWVRNPARIIPRMEMPAIQLPVKGVLHDDIDEQLAAVWNVLNEPGFTPPLPNPVRIVRSRNVPDKDGKWTERANVLTDVFVVDGVTYDSAVVIGLPNRHNVLFDLEHNRLAAWWTGDTALERTKGKSWYWEPGGTMVVKEPIPRRAIGEGEQDGELELAAGAEIGTMRIQGRGQDLVELVSISHTRTGVTFTLHAFTPPSTTPCVIRQTFEPLTRDLKHPDSSGFRRIIEVEPALGMALQWLPLESESFEDQGGDAIVKGAAGRPRLSDLSIDGESNGFAGDSVGVLAAPEQKLRRFETSYLVDLPIDTFPNDIPPAQAPPPIKLDVVPGFEAVQLPITVAEMPTGLAWKKDGTLVFTSLKGRVVEARDTNGDGLEDALRPVSDDLAAPYGIAVAEQDGKEVLDVINKYGLVRLHDDDGDGYRERIEVVASGWGHTDDYHDWAVGLPKILGGGYYVALPCQQDNRDPKKATLRGQGLKLLPRTPTKDDPRRFSVEPFCGGLRFPMGLAVNKAGDLFASDNQGNYNPFNEINHLVPGARYGFINKLEAKPGFNPPVESPALELPHPWTRSLNGICFLDTPAAVREKRRAAGLDENLFGEFEGHLIGCEYNYRALYRMALEKVDGVYQGAALPFSDLPKEKQPTFEGPVVCEVSPSGDLYVGNMQDSGWGGGRNTGSLVRLKPAAAKSVNKLPAGIAAISAHVDGFTLRFTQPIDRAAAADSASYTLESFRRISTPQYGGSDVDRSAVRVISAVPSADGRQVRLTLDKMKQGFVYEFHLRSLAPAGESWFPAEAFYTLKRVPQGT
jgi:mono/diheme cytochrome c family protein